MPVWWAALGTVTALRTAAAAAVPLQGTEAYYWLWSLHPAAGYYDHPPLIAWAIRASTGLVGTHELGVRLPSLAGVTLATLAVWWLTRRLFGEEAGARAGRGFWGHGSPRRRSPYRPSWCGTGATTGLPSPTSWAAVWPAKATSTRRGSSNLRQPRQRLPPPFSGSCA